MRPSKRGDRIGTSASSLWRQRAIPYGRSAVEPASTAGRSASTSVQVGVAPLLSGLAGHGPVMRTLLTSGHAGRKGIGVPFRLI